MRVSIGIDVQAGRDASRTRCGAHVRRGLRPLLAFVVWGAAVVAWPVTTHGQAAARLDAEAPEGLTLARALGYAADHYPAVKAALEQVTAAAAGVDVARAAYLPRLDTLWQSNRATANNVFGQLLPQSVLPALVGPVLPQASGDSVWGSAVGALLTWEAVDLGLRRAGVASAEAAAVKARHEHDLTKLEVQYAVGTAYLAVAAAERAVTAARGDLERRTALARVARGMADAQLRPGAEASRAEAERALADTRIIQARQALSVAQAHLGRLLGAPMDLPAIDDSALFEALPTWRADVDAPPASHPLAEVRQAAIGVAEAQEGILAHTDRPRVLLQSSLFARGSGAATSGPFDGGLTGLRLTRANWAAGVQVLFPNLFAVPALRARKAVAAANTRAETARYDEAILSVSSQRLVARAVMDATQAIAANTPVQLAAAKLTESQASARYAAGLASIVEVADAQNLLAQAEFQDAIARVDVWRALLADAVARGDIGPFIALGPRVGPAGGR